MSLYQIIGLLLDNTACVKTLKPLKLAAVPITDITGVRPVGASGCITTTYVLVHRYIQLIVINRHLKMRGHSTLWGARRRRPQGSGSNPGCQTIHACKEAARDKRDRLQWFGSNTTVADVSMTTCIFSYQSLAITRSHLHSNMYPQHVPKHSVHNTRVSNLSP